MRENMSAAILPDPRRSEPAARPQILGVGEESTVPMRQMSPEKAAAAEEQRRKFLERDLEQAERSKVFLDFEESLYRNKMLSSFLYVIKAHSKKFPEYTVMRAAFLAKAGELLSRSDEELGQMRRLDLQNYFDRINDEEFSATTYELAEDLINRPRRQHLLDAGEEKITVAEAEADLVRLGFEAAIGRDDVEFAYYHVVAAHKRRSVDYRKMRQELLEMLNDKLEKKDDRLGAQLRLALNKLKTRVEKEDYS